MITERKYNIIAHTHAYVHVHGRERERTGRLCIALPRGEEKKRNGTRIL